MKASRILVVVLALAIVVTLALMKSGTLPAQSTPAVAAGDVLIAGGDAGGLLFSFLASGLFINSTKAAEIFDPTTSQFTAVGSLNADREGASGTALPNGKILVAGGASCTANSDNSGSTCTALNTAELFDPGTSTFTLAGSGSGNKMVSARFAHNAALISGCNCALDGDVLLVGGDSGTFTVTGTGLITTPQPNDSANTAIQAELYDFRTDTFTATGSLMTGEEAAAVVAIPNGAGKVLIAGGDDQGFFRHSIATAEIYNPATRTFSLTGSLKTARELAASIALDPTIVTGGLSGEIMLVGGLSATGNLLGNSLSSIETFNPANGTFTTSNASLRNPVTAPSLTLFPTGTDMGEVLIAGGVTVTGNGNGPIESCIL